MTMLNIILICVPVYMIAGLGVLTLLSTIEHDRYVPVNDVWTCMVFWLPVLIFAVFYRTHKWIKTRKAKK